MWHAENDAQRSACGRQNLPELYRSRSFLLEDSGIPSHEGAPEQKWGSGGFRVKHSSFSEGLRKGCNVYNKVPSSRDNSKQCRYFAKPFHADNS